MSTAAEAGPRPADGPPLVSVRGLTMHFANEQLFSFGAKRRVVHAADDVDLDLWRGETVGLVGESGSGKTTVGRAILQLYRPTAGSVTFDGVELTRLGGRGMGRMRRRMQMIFQDPFASLNPRMSVGDIIAEPLDIHRLARGRARLERVADLLRRVGLDPRLASRYPHEFSGGQLQRVGVARALAVEPDFIVADEPVSALDVSIQAQLVNLLEELQADLRLTYLFIAHDLAVVRHISDRVAVMYLGKIVEIAGRSDIYGRPMHPYTQALLSAVPIPDPTVEASRRRTILTGDIPSPVDPPSGCRFRTRCFLRTRLGDPEICSTVEPPLSEHQPGHWAACHFTEPATAPARETGKQQAPADPAAVVRAD